MHTSSREHFHQAKDLTLQDKCVPICFPDLAKSNQHLGCSLCSQAKPLKCILHRFFSEDSLRGKLCPMVCWNLGGLKLQKAGSQHLQLLIKEKVRIAAPLIFWRETSNPSVGGMTKANAITLQLYNRNLDSNRNEFPNARK